MICGDRVRRSPSAGMANWRNQAPNAPNPDQSAITAMEGDTDSEKTRSGKQAKTKSEEITLPKNLNCIHSH